MLLYTLFSRWAIKGLSRKYLIHPSIFKENWDFKSKLTFFQETERVIVALLDCIYWYVIDLIMFKKYDEMTK